MTRRTKKATKKETVLPTPRRSINILTILVVVVIGLMIIAATVSAFAKTDGKKQHAAATTTEKPAVSTSPSLTLPASMGAIGDSISKGSNTQDRNASNVENNWATGTNSDVNSIAARIMALQNGKEIDIYNVAHPGDGTEDIAPQIKSINKDKPDFTTYFVGINDICASGVRFATMTPAKTFQSRTREALRNIDSDTKILALSVVNLQSLVSIGQQNEYVRESWDDTGICPAMLSNPDSDEQDDVDRRAVVNKRISDYNLAIKTECEKLQNCTYDNDAVYNTEFTADDLSAFDYFHPGIKGQAKIADAVWPSVKKIYGL